MSVVPATVKDRKSAIGGSDAAAVAGECPYRSRLDVYLEKRGIVAPFAGNRATRLGTLCEDAIAEAYTMETGRRVRRVNRPFVHERFQFIRGHIDRKVVGDPTRIVEMKLVGIWAQEAWGEPGSDDIPVNYRLQAQHYLGLTGAQVCDVVALSGTDLGVYPVHRDERLIENLFEIERHFWREHVEKECPPPAERPGDALKLWPEEQPGTSVDGQAVTVDLDGESLELWRAVELYVGMKADEKSIGQRIAAVKEAICAAIGDAERIDLDGNPLMTWKAQESRRIDVTRLREEAPELASKFTTTTSTRVLRACKAAKSLSQSA